MYLYIFFVLIFLLFFDYAELLKSLYCLKVKPVEAFYGPKYSPGLLKQQNPEMFIVLQHIIELYDLKKSLLHYSKQVSSKKYRNYNFLKTPSSVFSWPYLENQKWHFQTGKRQHSVRWLSHREKV